MVDINWTLLAQIINFLILVGAVTWFGYKPIVQIMEERQQKIADSIANAENLKWAADRIKTEHDQHLATARAEAAVIIEKANKTAGDIREQMLAQVREEQDNLLRMAKEQIEREKVNALLEVRAEVVALSMQIAGKVVGQKIDEEADKKLINEFLDEITKKPGGLPC